MKTSNQIKHIPPDMSKLPGGWLTSFNFSFSCNPLKQPKVLSYNKDTVHYVLNFVAGSCLNELTLKILNDAPKMAPVSIQGYQSNTSETVGSHRVTMFNEGLARSFELLFDDINFPKKRVMNEFTPTDWWQNDKNRREWEYVGVSPLLRFMSYSSGGRHFTHYDAGFIYPDDNFRTLMSFVLYLTTNNSGQTRIIDDKQNNLPVWDRNHNDWTRETKKEEVLLNFFPTQGDVLIFDHRVAHDVSKFTNEGFRNIIRGDLIFKSKK